MEKKDLKPGHNAEIREPYDHSYRLVVKNLVIFDFELTEGSDNASLK